MSYCQLMEMEALAKLTGEIKPRVSGHGIPWHLMVGAGGKCVLKQKEEDIRQAQSELWGYVHHWRAIPKGDSCFTSFNSICKAMGFGFPSYLTPLLFLAGASAHYVVLALRD